MQTFDAPQPFNTVLADKKIGGHLPNCQRAILLARGEPLSFFAEPSILAMSSKLARARRKNLTRKAAAWRLASRLRPKTILRFGSSGSMGQREVFLPANPLPSTSVELGHMKRLGRRQWTMHSDVFPASVPTRRTCDLSVSRISVAPHDAAVFTGRHATIGPQQNLRPIATLAFRTGRRKSRRRPA
jgi:hypothetical protein